MICPMDPPAGDSVIKLGPNQWAIGSMVVCEKLDKSQKLPADAIASWMDGDNTFCLLEGDKHDRHSSGAANRVHLAGEAFATWLIGTVYIKAHPWCEGLQSEASTIAFVKKTFPGIPVPEVVHSWTDKNLGRSFLLTKGMDGQTLESAWPGLSGAQRIARVNELAQYACTLAQKTSTHLETCSGLGVQEVYFMQDPPDSVPIWWPQILPRFTADELEEHLQNMSTVPPPKIHDRFVFYHSDLNPTNIMVSMDGNTITGILDWDTAGYFPRFLVTAKIQRWRAFLLESGDNEYQKLLADGLQGAGFQSELEVFSAWLGAMS